MEVHHHAHTASPPAGRAGKKWTHYFWEFLMLFLAVFCGFIAESKREHYVEHKREIQFIRSYIEDLKIDIRTLSNQVPLFKEKITKIDTLVGCLKRATTVTGSNKSYLFFGMPHGFINSFQLTGICNS